VDAIEDAIERAKRRFGLPDRLDLNALLRMLMRFASGERGIWSVVRVPSPEAEDARQLHRELKTLQHDRTRVTNRIRALLATQGVLDIDLGPTFEATVKTLVLWDGLPLPEQTQNRVHGSGRTRGT